VAVAIVLHRHPLLVVVHNLKIEEIHLVNQEKQERKQKKLTWGPNDAIVVWARVVSSFAAVSGGCHGGSGSGGGGGGEVAEVATSVVVAVVVVVSDDTAGTEKRDLAENECSGHVSAPWGAKSQRRHSLSPPPPGNDNHDHAMNHGRIDTTAHPTTAVSNCSRGGNGGTSNGERRTSNVERQTSNVKR
jgi:hypothetical protein